MFFVEFCRTKAQENGLIDEIKSIQKWMLANISHQKLRENVNKILSENAQTIENIAVGSAEIKLTGCFSDVKIREKIVVPAMDFGVYFGSENEQIAFANLIKNDNPTLCYAYISRNLRRVETRDLSKAMFGTPEKYNHAAACSLARQGLPFYGMRPQKI